MKVIDSSTRALAPGHTLQAQIADVSDSGVRVRLLTAVPVGAKLELWIISPVLQETLLVSGKVRWCHAAPGDATRHQAGIEIAREPTTGFLRWREMAASLTGG